MMLFQSQKIISIIAKKKKKVMSALISWKIFQRKQCNQQLLRRSYSIKAHSRYPVQSRHKQNQSPTHIMLLYSILVVGHDFKSVRVCLVIGFKYNFLFLIQKMMGPSPKQFVWQLFSLFALKNFHYSWLKLRPTFTCFRQVLVTVQKTSGNFAIFCTN